jgi:transposase InsO family protein
LKGQFQEKLGPGAQLLTYTDDVELHAKSAEWEAFYNYHRPHGGLGWKNTYERLVEKCDNFFSQPRLCSSHLIYPWATDVSFDSLTIASQWRWARGKSP